MELIYLNETWNMNVWYPQDMVRDGSRMVAESARDGPGYPWPSTPTLFCEHHHHHYHYHKIACHTYSGNLKSTNFIQVNFVTNNGWKLLFHLCPRSTTSTSSSSPTSISSSSSSSKSHHGGEMSVMKKMGMCQCQIPTIHDKLQLPTVIIGKLFNSSPVLRHKTQNWNKFYSILLDSCQPTSNTFFLSWKVFSYKIYCINKAYQGFWCVFSYASTKSLPAFSSVCFFMCVLKWLAWNDV